MVQRVGGKRRKSRYMMGKSKGLSITRYLQKFSVGDRVQLKAEPSVHEGLFHLVFYGRSGVVSGMQGGCYKVQIRDGGKMKIIIVHPVHLVKQL